jgi:hypothetical protein
MTEVLEIVSQGFTEEQFQAMASGHNLSHEEWECLRKHYGLPYDEAFVFGLDVPHYIATAFWKIGKVPKIYC